MNNKEVWDAMISNPGDDGDLAFIEGQVRMMIEILDIAAKRNHHHRDYGPIIDKLDNTLTDIYAAHKKISHRREWL